MNMNNGAFGLAGIGRGRNTSQCPDGRGDNHSSSYGFGGRGRNIFAVQQDVPSPNSPHSQAGVGRGRPRNALPPPFYHQNQENDLVPCELCGGDVRLCSCEFLSPTKSPVQVQAGAVAFIDRYGTNKRRQRPLTYQLGASPSMTTSAASAYIPPKEDVAPELWGDDHVHQGEFMDHLMDDDAAFMPGPAYSALDFERWGSLKGPFASSLDIAEQLKPNLASLGFVKPTSVQSHAIPRAIQGMDLLVMAPTGSGKTTAFWLSILTNLINDHRRNAIPLRPDTAGNKCYPFALVLAPTRELADQIRREGERLALGLLDRCKLGAPITLFSRLIKDEMRAGVPDSVHIRVADARGGVHVGHQTQTIQGCVVLVCTMGRLMHLLSDNVVMLGGCRYLVVDEADMMIADGFHEELHWLLTSPESGLRKADARITQMFSATVSPTVQKMADVYLRDRHVKITVGRAMAANTDIRQTIHQVTPAMSKFEQIDSLLVPVLELHKQTEKTTHNKVLIFVATRDMSNHLALYLEGKHNIRVICTSSNLNQCERDGVLRQFRAGERMVIVATYLMSRGLDIPGVDHVMLYDFPKNMEDYIHSIGRTGRIGNRGTSYALFDIRRDAHLARELVQTLNATNQHVPDWLSVLDSTADLNSLLDEKHKHRMALAGLLHAPNELCANPVQTRATSASVATSSAAAAVHDLFEMEPSDRDRHLQLNKQQMSNVHSQMRRLTIQAQDESEQVGTHTASLSMIASSNSQLPAAATEREQALKPWMPGYMPYTQTLSQAHGQGQAHTSYSHQEGTMPIAELGAFGAERDLRGWEDQSNVSHSLSRRNQRTRVFHPDQNHMY